MTAHFFRVSLCVFPRCFGIINLIDMSVIYRSAHCGRRRSGAFKTGRHSSCIPSIVFIIAKRATYILFMRMRIFKMSWKFARIRAGIIPIPTAAFFVFFMWMCRFIITHIRVGMWIRPPSAWLFRIVCLQPWAIPNAILHTTRLEWELFLYGWPRSLWGTFGL